MGNGCIEFRQRVSVDGYRWEKIYVPRFARHVLGLFEGGRSPLGDMDSDSPEYWAILDEMWDQADSQAETHREYAPEDVPDLYRAFANTAISQDGVLEFAGRYGLLGVGETIPVEEETNPDGSIWREYGRVEYAHEWKRQILLMRGCVEILDLADDPFRPDAIALSKIFTRRGGRWHVRSAYMPGYRGQGKIEHIDLEIWSDDPHSFASIGHDDVLSVATEFLRIVADRQLSGTTTASVVRDGDSGTLSLVYRPTSLLGAMWLQFAKVMTHTDNTRACLECGRTFEFQRRTRLFCGEACQKKFNRKKIRTSRKSGVISET
ncbi:MAG: hypothetical protein HYX78_15805 [Armatimonadetes bacterium]|nr:hypothetical protein [Armatimonadota bacterium]